MFFKLHGLEGKVNLGKGICYFMMKLCLWSYSML